MSRWLWQLIGGSFLHPCRRRTTHCSRPSPASLSSSSCVASARLSVSRWLRAAEFGRYAASLNDAMKFDRLMNKAGSLLLGGLDGLLFGSVVEALRRSFTPAYLESYIRQQSAASPTGNIGYVFSCIGDNLPVFLSDIPSLCMMVFAIIALLAHTLWRGRPHSILLWQVIGIVSMTVAVVLHSAAASPCHHTYLLPPLWRWALCLPLVAGINLIYGLFVIVSGDAYARWKRVGRLR